MALSPEQQKTQAEIDAAKAIVSELAFLSGVKAGGEWIADSPRDDGHTHEEVLDNLALGGRNLYPSDKDAEKVAEMFADEMVRSLKKVGQTHLNKRTQKQITFTAEKQAKKALNTGLDKPRGEK